MRPAHRFQFLANGRNHGTTNANETCLPPEQARNNATAAPSLYAHAVALTVTRTRKPHTQTKPPPPRPVRSRRRAFIHATKLPGPSDLIQPSHHFQFTTDLFMFRLLRPIGIKPSQPSMVRTNAIAKVNLETHTLIFIAVKAIFPACRNRSSPTMQQLPSALDTLRRRSTEPQGQRGKKVLRLQTMSVWVGVG
ncbi:hypothetical protein N0V85_009191 [Neurospora sp. IMI 360204]|nr:hypothetical protein N0V85_009191 [Neurospora sp. IMI 360204]